MLLYVYDIKYVGLSKKQLKQDSKEKEFKEYDPDKIKLRKQGKIGASKFKSKSKFKRRK